MQRLNIIEYSRIALEHQAAHTTCVFLQTVEQQIYPKLSATFLDITILMISFIARDGFSVVVVSFYL